MRRVLFVQGAAERAGAESVLGLLLRNLSAVDPVVAFVAEGPFVDEVAAMGVDVIRLPSSGRLRNPVRAARTVRSVARAVEETGADVVQATGEKMSVYAGWAARRTHRPCVFWLHDAPARSASARAVQLALRAAPKAAVVTCAAWLGLEFSRRLRTRATCIHNGIDAAELPEPRAARPALLAEAEWPEGAIVFGHFARLQRWKGTDVFLRAAARLARNEPRARFLVCGGALYGWERGYADALPALASSLGLDDLVRFAGYRHDALGLMGACDAVVHASTEPDPFPMVVLEAMGLGRALVCTRTRGPEEVVEDGRTGLLVPPGDAVVLAGAMAAVAASPALRASLGQQARKAVLERFTAARMAQRFEDLYRKLAPAKRVVA